MRIILTKKDREFFAECGRMGDRTAKSRGGKKAARNMTQAQRTARARTAGLASVAARKARKGGAKC